jgi:hypothetical protein
MDANESREPTLADLANTSYWDSGASVNDIAAELDLSKGSLYGMIRPHGAGLDCPECGSELEYPNRTARDKRFVTCSGCGLEEEEDVIRALVRSDAPVVTPRAALSSKRTLAATVLLGAAAGIMLVRWMRR